MQNSKKSFKFVKRTLLVFFLGFIGLCVYSAQGPDEILILEREIPSSLSPDRIDRNLSALNRWPQWYSSLASATLLSGSQILQTGAVLQLKMDPNKGPQKRFDLTAEVEDYVPAKLLQLGIKQDSSGRLTRLFDQLTWKIEVAPQGEGSLIRATVTAHTLHWRARLFGRLTKKILLNQVFYPNLIQLAELRQPFSVNQTPHKPPGAL